MARGTRRSAVSSVMVRQAEQQAAAWAGGLAELHERISPRFGRVEPHRQALGYLHGLLSQVERKNSWWLAEQAGDAAPDGMQRLLNGSGWDADGVRDDIRSYAVERLAEADAVLVVDETGFVKKGTHSAGVARQYTGTAGRIENAQVGVFLAYASPAGVALIDRELYLPKVWTDDRERCRAAGISDDVSFQTKPQLAQAMLERAVGAQVRFGWVTGDTVYGGDRRLRVWLEQHAIPHVMAVKCSEPVWAATEHGPSQVAAQQVIDEIEPERWLRLNAGHGSKGKRFYDWVRVPLWRLGWPANVGFWLLARRSTSDPGELAYYVCFAPEATSLATLVQVAGRRWRVEEAFEQAKGEVGLDHYQVRQYGAWYRHVTLAMLALAFLAVTRATVDDPIAGLGGPWS
jgi:SRSO17 transposase